MTTTPIPITNPSFKTIEPKDGRSRLTPPQQHGNPFEELLFQAVEERSGLPNGTPLTHNTVNALVEAVMTALRQAKESMGTSLSPGLGSTGNGSAFDEAWAMEPKPAWVQHAITHHPKTRAGTDPTQKIPSKLEGGNYDQIIQRAADRYGVDPDLIKSVIQVESSGNPKAVSPAGAMGMMQLMPATAKELGVKNPFNAEENIMGGTLYLSRLLDRYDGNVRSALAAYNWGMGNLERQPASAMPTETRRYVSRIMGMMDGMV